MLSSRPFIALVLAAVLQAASAQDLKEQVWAVFAYNLYGDRVPTALPRPNMLTPYGANALYAAGSAFRDRYVAIHSTNVSPSTRIESISSYALEDQDLDILSATDPSVIASAQAFMQGLYPPLNQTYGVQYPDPSYFMANGSWASAPFNGYQYPRIVTASSDDPQSIVVAGQDNCLLHQIANADYELGSDTQEIVQETEAFYNDLYSTALTGVFDLSSADYVNAVAISEFLEYQVLHNETLFHSVSHEQVELARWYADQYTFATNGNAGSSGPIENDTIRTIAGQTLTGHILDAFDNNVLFRGTTGKITLVFGGYEPAVALISLMQLASQDNKNFNSRPALGASMVLELFSLESDAFPTYPDPSQLYVRFLLRNGTTTPEFQSYPLFGLSPSSIEIPYTEFKAKMETVSLNSTAEWCLRCDSSSVFCSGVLNDTSADATAAAAVLSSSKRKGVSPAVAGVIGAVVTLVVVGIALVSGFFLLGMRMHRGRRPSLEEIKGGIDLGSESNLALREHAAPPGKAVVT
ncbi:histidine acid phosphatase [Aspergillus heteromorphus CBS 117.55]|uniref:Histidine acid phosphatase n=1 Tax=Aspergillus heteromorphus CBS 117.55 TaxID=1448321 RepID=A0A317WER7_9EURO|nr:histidine acid phosphatase [Aspergillus heteromorphus CBS 117.55]PWY84893.1 histidine acid phosphatase [Aspergillus heteromorphus CBS 117.55]